MAETQNSKILVHSDMVQLLEVAGYMIARSLNTSVVTSDSAGVGAVEEHVRYALCQLEAPCCRWRSKVDSRSKN